MKINKIWFNWFYTNDGDDSYYLELGEVSGSSLHKSYGKVKKITTVGLQIPGMNDLPILVEFESGDMIEVYNPNEVHWCKCMEEVKK